MADDITTGDASADNNEPIPTGTDSGSGDKQEDKKPELDKGDGGPGDVGKATPAPTQPGIQPDNPVRLESKPVERKPESKPRSKPKPKKKSGFIGGYSSRRARKSRGKGL